MRPARGAGQFTNGCIPSRACHIEGMENTDPKPAADPQKPEPAKPALPKEIGGAPGPEPTRYGDWAHKGRVTDF